MDINILKKILNKPIYLNANKRHLSIFLRQFAVLISSGIKPNKAIEILKDQKEIKSLNNSLNGVYEDLNNGIYLSKAFSKYNIYDEFFISMIETGEETGKIDDIALKLSAYYEKEDEINKKIIGALIYPLIIFITSVLVLAFVFKFIMPNFIILFENSSMVLPFSTRILISISSFLSNNIFIIILILMILLIIYIIMIKRKNFKIKIDYLKFKIPIFSKYYIQILTGKISRALSISYGNGINLLDSLAIISIGMANLYMQNKLFLAIEEIQEGQVISKAFENTNILPQLFNSMIEVGEETGDLENILDIISNYYKKESDYAIDSMIKIFEPLMIVLMAIIVGFIVISIAIPMFDLINNYNY